MGARRRFDESGVLGFGRFGVFEGADEPHCHGGALDRFGGTELAFAAEGSRESCLLLPLSQYGSETGYVNEDGIPQDVVICSEIFMRQHIAQPHGLPDR